MDEYFGNGSFSGFDGSGYSIAILDTGADLDHPDFGPATGGVADRIVYHEDFADGDMDASDAQGHGTHVASIAAGIATGADLIILKVFENSGAGNLGYVEEALQWVVQNAATYNIVAVNMSLGLGENHSTNHADDTSDELELLGDGLLVTSIAAAGNGFFLPHMSAQGVDYPAADASAIAVGATWDASAGQQINWSSGAIDYTQSTDRVVSFSQRDDDLLHIMAPGARITAAGLNGGSATRSGTSMAAPHVAAAVALAQQMNDQFSSGFLDRAELIDLFQDTGVTVNDGDNEDDNVTNTNLNFQRLAVESMAYRLFEPTATDLVNTSDWGFSETDNKTFDTTPTFTGTVPEDSHVWLYVDGSAVADVQLTGGATTYNLTPSTPLSTGTKSITIKVAESGSIAEANRSHASSALSLNVSASDSISLGTQSFAARMSETLVVSGSNTGSSTLDAAWGSPARKLTKTGTGTLTVSTVSEKTSSVTFDADAGTTQFTVDTGVAGIPGTSTRVANWTINGDAAVNFTTHQNLAALNIEDSGVITVTTATPPSYKVLYVGALDIVNGGKLDLTNNTLVIDYANDTAAQSDESDIRDWIIDGRGSTGLGGAWNGSTGITSSTAATRNLTAADSRSVGYAVNADMPLGSQGTFIGQTVDSSSILVRYTVTGDFDLDGDVDDDDNTILGAFYDPFTAQPHWGLGDADYNGFVNDDDVTLFGAFYDTELES